MPARFAWKDDRQRAMVYIIEGDWNWKDYHQAVRASAFSLTGIEHPVDSVIDLRASTRPSLLAGLWAHLRSFGRKNQACLSGRAAVIGLPAAALETLPPLADKTLPTADGFVRFVDNEAELERLLDEWANRPPSS